MWCPGACCVVCPFSQAESASMSFSQLLDLAPGKRRSYHDDLTIVIMFLRK